MGVTKHSEIWLSVAFWVIPDVSIEPVTLVFESSRFLEAEDKFLHIAVDLKPSDAE
jgi:hypothetical protein